MVKKHRKIMHSASGSVRAGKAFAPDYYQEFKCNGPECPDTCCAGGWAIDVDVSSWRRYQACENSKLKQVFQITLVEVEKTRQTPQKFAHIKMRGDGSCSFLEADGWCAIQRELGEEALSNTCTLYPRYCNQVGNNLEFGLLLSCPVAAKLILLRPKPARMALVDSDAHFNGRETIHLHAFAKEANQAFVMKLLNDIREMARNILQFRELSLGARMMILGCLLDEMDRVGRRVDEVRQILNSFSGIFSNPEAVEAQFLQIPSQLPRKLQVVTGFLVDFYSSGSPRLSECMRAAIAGWMGEGGGGEQLILRYMHAYENHYLPYMREKSYVLENYLVAHVQQNIFPFCRGGFFELYREMVCNLSIIQTILVGMAGHYQKMDDEKVVQLIQSFVRSTAHHVGYLGKLNENIGGQHDASLPDLVWMLKEC